MLLALLLAVATPPPHNSDAVVSPDGGAIAYLSTRDGVTNVHRMRSDGTHDAALTDTREVKGSPRWSADGRRILFSVVDGQASTLESVDSTGSHRETTAHIAGRAARLSPDGARVLYATGSWTAVSLFVANIDGSKAVLVNDGASVAWNPDWSPDGKQIAYTGRAGDRLDIWLVNADGTNRRQLTHIISDDGQAQVPAWSADGRQLAMQVTRKGDGTIWIADAATGSAHEVAPHHDHPYLDEVPSWFPDGKRIVFQSDRSGTMQIWTMNADGSDPRQLTH